MVVAATGVVHVVVAVAAVVGSASSTGASRTLNLKPFKSLK